MLNRTVARYATVAAIVLVVGGLLVWRDMVGRVGGGVYGVVEQASRPQVGDLAPDFVLEEAGTGRSVRLSDYRGKSVVLNFWATWCGPCRAEMPVFQQAYEQDGGRSLVILAVDYRESDEVVLAFQRDFGLTFPLVMDREGDVRAQYGAQGLPATFFIDRDGIVRTQNLGPVIGDLLREGLAAAAQGSQ